MQSQAYHTVGLLSLDTLHIFAVVDGMPLAFDVSTYKDRYAWQPSMGWVTFALQLRIRLFNVYI